MAEGVYSIFYWRRVCIELVQGRYFTGGGCVLNWRRIFIELVEDVY